MSVKSPLLAPARVLCWLLMLGGCATIPKDALTLSPDSLERRQLQTRRIDAISEKDLLSASAGVLQDLGFNIDESETKLGVIVASKDRSAVSPTQVAGAVVAGLFTYGLGYYYTSIDKTQKIRVSLVTRPVTADGTPVNNSHFIRITIQRLVWNTDGQISRTEAIEEPDIYQAFFERLSKSVFLEVQQI